MTESRVRALLTSLALDRMGTDPVSCHRVAGLVKHAHATIACLDDPDRDEAHEEVREAHERWMARLCSVDTGPISTVENKSCQ